MNTSLTTQIENYLSFCESQKRLDAKTVKAYRIDLTQFPTVICKQTVTAISIEVLERYISFLHKTYKPKTSKRKIASIKAFFATLNTKTIF